MEEENGLFNDLLEAIILNDKASVIKLLKKGVSPNDFEPYIKFTPLHCAASLKDSYEVSLILLGAGADTSAKNFDNETAADIAERCDNKKLLNILKELEKSENNLLTVKKYKSKYH